MVRAFATCFLPAWRPHCIALPLLLCIARVADSQSTTATLQGVVLGRDGSVPREALVEVHSRRTGLRREVRSIAGGTFRLLGLPPDVYDVSVRAIGYRQQRRDRVRLVVGQQATLDFALERGAVELEPMVVTGERAFEVERTDLSTAVLQEELEKLPLNSRNVLNLAVIAPGIRTFAPEGGRSVPAAGPLPTAEPRFSNLYVDGIEWKGMYVGQVTGVPAAGSIIPQEAVREFRVYLNPYDVEYTHGASYVINAVTHRGGDALEGSMFGFLQNRALVARGSFQAEKPEYARYQVGGNLRGPLARNRLFFSLSYEGQFSDNFVDVVPPLPTAAPAIWDAYAGTFGAPSRVHGGLLRLTAPLRAHILDAIWATRHVRAESGFGAQLTGRLLSHEAGIVGGIRANSLQLRDTYASASFTNELSLHVIDMRNQQSPITAGPTLQYPDFQIGRLNYPFLIRDRQLHLVDKVSLTRAGPAGEHVIKAGLETGRSRTHVYRPSRKDGVFIFATDTSTLPTRAQIAMGLDDPSATREAQATIHGWVVGGYVQDQWHPTRALTVSAGLRYDADIGTLNQTVRTPWASDTALRRALGEQYLNTGDRTNDLDNVAPRVALSWDVLGSRRLYLRAGYGVMYDRVPVFGAVTEGIAIGWRTYSFQNPGTTDPAELRRRIALGTGTSAPPNLILLKDRLEAPANHQWSAGIGDQLTEHLALNLDYLHQRVTHAYVSVVTNLASGGRRPITDRFGDITLWDDAGDARFRALLASLTYDRQPTRVSVAYTLGWAESEFGEFTVSDYPDPSAYSMQRSEGDERHRVVVSGSTSLPLGLDFSAITVVASPHPFFATIGTDANGNGSTTDDWPDGVRTDQRNGWQHWYRTVDLRLGKTLPAASGRLHVTAEVFNALNWANHADYRGTQNSIDYGAPVGDYARRQGQIGVRYLF
jgi:hypothetical protein